MAKITALKIHPAIGVARIGNHPTDFYIGPEKPNDFSTPENVGGFKTPDPSDNNMLKICRQGARFRVYAYFDDGEIKEIDSNSDQITWKVKLANTKAKSRGFYGVGRPEDDFRNDFVKGADRDGLAIEPPEISITGVSQEQIFEKRNFIVKDSNGAILKSDDIILGTCKTDENGNLIVLGGFGNTGSVKASPIRAYDDNNYWYDDISDGYVKATVKFHDAEEEITASDAWVICAPPKYVPEMHPMITMYDTLLNKYVSDGTIADVQTPLFFRDIYPIIKRASNVRWLHAMNAHNSMEMLLSPAAPVALRKRLFDKLRKPDGTGGNMPRLFGDEYEKEGRLHLTALQYTYLNKWVSNNFETDTIDNTKPPVEITAAGLDQAALENCIGGAFYPGIEGSWFLRDKYNFSEPFRLDSSLIVPGDISKQMALPWQADFLACAKEDDRLTPNLADTIGWWPFARPDDVFAEGENTSHPWAGAPEFSRYEDMVEKWMLLGFVVEKEGRFVEIQRQPPVV